MLDFADDIQPVSGAIESRPAPFSGMRMLLLVSDPVFFPERGDNGDRFRCGERGIPTEFMGYLASDLFALGVDIHVAQPEYRKVFARHAPNGGRSACGELPAERCHLTRERVNRYAGDPEDNSVHDNIRIAASFQRDVANYLVPRLRPDLIHCYGWMAGLIPAAAAGMGVPCVFTLVDPETVSVPLWFMEEIGMDVGGFWRDLYYQRLPSDFEETRATNGVDFLLSGIHAATHLNLVNSDMAIQLVGGLNGRRLTRLQRALRRKFENSSVSIFHENAIKTQDYIDVYEMVLKRNLI